MATVPVKSDIKADSLKIDVKPVPFGAGFLLLITLFLKIKRTTNSRPNIYNSEQILLVFHIMKWYFKKKRRSAAEWRSI